jgi:hypothetical protein
MTRIPGSTGASGAWTHDRPTGGMPLGERLDALVRTWRVPSWTLSGRSAPRYPGLFARYQGLPRANAARHALLLEVRLQLWVSRADSHDAARTKRAL